MDKIIQIILGVLFIVIGIINRKGNISLLHSYHRKRVSEEDKLPLGKMVGLGMIIIGATLILVGVLSIIENALQESVLSTIKLIVLAVGLILGLGINLYAINKFNKGIF